MNTIIDMIERAKKEVLSTNKNIEELLDITDIYADEKAEFLCKKCLNNLSDIELLLNAIRIQIPNDILKKILELEAKR